MNNTDSNEKLEIMRHTVAHILAQAVKRLYPKAVPTIGPVIENGFYYDFDNLSIKESDLSKIEDEMKRIIKENLKIERIEYKTKKDAEIDFKENKYKIELIKEADGKLSSYKQGDFLDLCRGPHLSHTGKVGVFKLISLASAYWRGDAKNKQLTRIYGTAFFSQKELDEYIKAMKRAEEYNHIKLGKELGLFVTTEVIGKGLPLLTPSGTTIKRELRNFIEQEELKRGYVYTDTPTLTKTELYKISGHLPYYKDSMFIFKIDNEEYALRPMTCPHQFMLYKSKRWSYKELPVRYAEFSILFRREQSGELHGLIRIFQFTLSDAHIICRPEQLESEFEGVLNLIKYILTTLGFEEGSYWYRFSKWDPKNKEKYIDNTKAWEETQKILKRILNKLNLKYEEAEGEAAFYGPKLDIQMKNIFGKEDTIITIQIDFAMPDRFDLTYVNEKDESVRPMIIHRSSIGCFERTIAMLIEKYEGKFPTWLAPIQAILLPISDKHIEYCREIINKMREKGIRVELDARGETTPKKVRDAELRRIPYILVVGDKEIEKNTLNVRLPYLKKVIGERPVEVVIDAIEKDIKLKNKIPVEF